MLLDSKEIIEMKISYLEDIISKVENGEGLSVLDLIKNEIKALGELNKGYQEENENKTVVKRENGPLKNRYYLKDGSVYVVKGRDYRYLYDAKSKVVTYEFENGQIERTFPSGLKEIRNKAGNVIIKNGAKEYEYL
ncbi:hypothetical protein ENBRE01_0904 [Enteropsectra breve]|nr:hypothetical protein ENBRE01_0904 [Enteropsectra breve]